MTSVVAHRARRGCDGATLCSRVPARPTVREVTTRNRWRFGRTRRSVREGRPGGYARGRARDRYREVLITIRRPLLAFCVVWYAFFIGLHLWADRFNDVVFGVMLTVPPWLTTVAVTSDVGAAAWATGANAETWTSEALAKALGKDYLILNDLQLGSRNLDHLVVGPSGLFVVETKWSSVKWTSYRGNLRLRQACKQVEHEALRLHRRLRALDIAVAPQPLVVVWGGGTRDWRAGTRVRLVNRTPIVAGQGIHEWSSTLESGVLATDRRDQLGTLLPDIVAS